MRILTGLAAALLAALSLAGCSGDDTEADAPAPSSSSSAEPTDDASEPGGDDTSDGDAPTVEVLDAGNDPQQELRLALQEGDVLSSVLTTDQTISVTGQPEVPVPTTTLQYDTEVTSADDDGAELLTTYGAAGVKGSGPQVGALRQILKGFEGTTVTAELAANGTTSDVEADVPDGADPTLEAFTEQLTSQSDQLSSPFPDEAVGEGAQWRVRNSAETDLQGTELTTRQVITYTLEALQGDDYALSYTVVGTVESGDGAAITIDGGKVMGAGRIVGRLDQAAPVSSSSRTITEIDATSGGQSQTVRTEYRLSLTSK